MLFPVISLMRKLIGLKNGSGGVGNGLFSGCLVSGSAEVERAGWWWPKLWDGSAAEDGSNVKK